jgi:hypothetical protein
MWEMGYYPQIEIEIRKKQNIVNIQYSEQLHELMLTMQNAKDKPKAGLLNDDENRNGRGS